MDDLKDNHGEPRSGYTLIEVIIALALSIVVLSVIAFAVDLHLRTLQSRRNHVEEAALARAVLRIMADDLRNAVQYKPIDFSAVEELAASSAGGLGEGLEGGGEGLGEGGLEGGGEEIPSEEEVEEEATSVAESIAPPTTPGLYGNQYELQIDISRLPRVDQYDPSLVAENVAVTDIPSDVKTVSYYLIEDSGSADVQSGTLDDDPTAKQTGLVRRVLDRAVTTWAANNGTIGTIDGSGEIVAPEVVYLEFRYFDGESWLTEWDSDEMEGFPNAVEIGVGIQPSNIGKTNNRSSTPNAPTTSPTTGPTEEMSFYRLVVHLPVSEIIGTTGEDEFTEEPL